MKRKDIISDQALADNRALHDGKEGFGGSGWKHWERIAAYSKELKAKTILDYGCGECSLSRKFRKEGIRTAIYEYDPAVRGRDIMPKPRDLVVCTDVLEHVEPEKLDAVLGHLYELTLVGAYLVAATRPANKRLPDGRNAHLIIEDTPWWMERIRDLPWRVERFEDVRGGEAGQKPHEVRVWLRAPK